MIETNEYLRRVNAALALREIPDNEAALVQLEKAVNLAPQDATVHLMLGLTLQDLGKFLEAETKFRLALSLRPDLLEAQQSLGLLLVRNQKYEDAISILQPLAEADPSNVPIAQALVEAYEKTDRKGEAIGILKSSIVLNNENVSLLKKLSELLLLSENISEAIEIADRVLAINRSSSSLNFRGILSALENKLPEAVSFLEEALNIDPANMAATQNLARACMLLGDSEKALEILNIGLNKDHENASLLPQKAQIFIDTNRLDEAEKILRILVSNPKYRKSSIVKYYGILLKLGKFQEALEVLHNEYDNVPHEQGIKLIDTVVKSGIDLYTEGFISPSRHLFEQILTIVPEHPMAINNLGFILLGERDWENGQNLFERAEKLGYVFPAILKTNQGYVVLNQNKYQVAISLFEQALKAFDEMKDSPTAILHIAYPFIMAGVANKADDYPTRYIRIDTAIFSNMATTYWRLGEVDLAFTFAERAIESDLEESAGYRILGCLHFLQENFFESRKAWEKAIQVNHSKEEETIIYNWLAELDHRVR